MGLFLDQDGLVTLWEKIKSVFAKKSDLVDSVYYPGENVNVRALPHIGGYTRLETAYNSEDTYITTDITLSADMEFEIRYKPTTRAYTRLLGRMNGSWGKYWFGLVNYGYAFSLFVRDTEGSGLESAIQQVAGHVYTIRGIINQGAATLYVKDETTGQEDTQSGNFTPNIIDGLPVQLFREQYRAHDMYQNTHVYHAIVRKDGKTVINWVPMRRESDGVVGFMNTVDGEFTEATEGSFNSGEELQNVKEYVIDGPDGFSGDYNDLTNKPTIPTKTSELTNDSHFTTFDGSYNSLTDKPTIPDTSGLAAIEDISAVGFSGDYNDLLNTPAIPMVPGNVSAFQNDVGYLVASDIENKVDKVSGKGLSTNDYTTAEKNKLAGIASGATANAGTITGVSLNGTSVATSGVANLQKIPTKININGGQKAVDQNGIVDLGTYLTEHQSLTHLAPIASPEFTGTPTAPTPTSASESTQIATKGYVDTAVAGASGGGSGSGKVYLGKCLTAAGTAAKVGTVDGTFTLEVGCIVGLSSTVTNTASNPTLNVANTGAYPIWHGNAKITTSYLYRAQQANCTTFFVFTGEYWHFISQGSDYNTQYSEITLANLNNDASSSAGLITGRRLQAALDAWKTSESLATESYVDTAIANAGTVSGVSQADLNTQLPPVGAAGTVKCIYKNTGNAAASIEIVPQNSAAAVEFLSVDGEQVPRTLLDAGVMSRTLNPNETIEVEFVFAPVAGLMPWRNSVVPQGVIGGGGFVETLVLPASVVVVQNRQGFDNLTDVWCLGPQPPQFGDLADISANVHAPHAFAAIYTSEYVTNGGYPVTIISY